MNKMVSSKDCNPNKYNLLQNFFNCPSKSSFRLQNKKFQTKISIAVRKSFSKRIKHNPYLWKHYSVFTAICLTREVHWKNSNSWLLTGNVLLELEKSLAQQFQNDLYLLHLSSHLRWNYDCSHTGGAMKTSFQKCSLQVGTRYLIFRELEKPLV